RPGNNDQPWLRHRFHDWPWLIGEEDQATERVGAGAPVHLPLEHFDAVNMVPHGIESPREAEPVGSGVLVGAQSGDEGALPNPDGSAYWPGLRTKSSLLFRGFPVMLV
ncbi:MAG TPA: hypothetical protein VI365_35230, partial [Trebonia sp.]